MIENRRNPSAAQADAAANKDFESAATAIISDNLGRLPGAVGLRPFYKGDVMAGTALTIRPVQAIISSFMKRSSSSGQETFLWWTAEAT